MSIQEIRSGLGGFAKDIKLNLGNVLSEEGSAGLSQNQIYGIALSCAYSTKNQDLVKALLEDASSFLSAEEINAAQSAATIMAMNNVYYRFLHLVGDKEYSQMRANLRMNVIANPGIPKKDFELYSLAVSAINGCGLCIESHVGEIIKAGISKEGVQSTIRISAVIQATAQALVIK